MDKSYETPAENQGTRRPKIGKKTLNHLVLYSLVLHLKLGKRVNLAMKTGGHLQKMIVNANKARASLGDASLTGDFDSYNYASIG